MNTTATFKYTFKVIDKFKNNSIVFESLDVFECVKFVKNKLNHNSYYLIPPLSFTLKKEYEWVHCSYKSLWNKEIITKIIKPNQYAIIDHFSNIVDTAYFKKLNIPQKKNKTNKYRSRDILILGQRLSRNRKNIKKIKSAYRRVFSNTWYGSGYTNNIVCGYRGIGTFSQIKKAVAHCNEYGYNIVRASRNGNNLPSRWDDIRCGVWEKENSWKHNSKRRKQWIAK